jgi:TrmH family RNA methyltransferase
VVIIGNESDGISQQTAAFVTERLFIPPYPSDRKGSESLNAAVASAVTLAEFRRRGRRR